MIQYWINKINNKFYLIIIGLSILTSIYGLYNTYKNHDDLIFQISTSIFMFFGLLLILKHSKLIYETKFIRIIYFLLGIQVIGTIIKIQHYPGSRIFYMISSLGFIVTYLYRYIKKENKILLDNIKVIWVIIYFSSIILINLSINFGDNLNEIGFIIFIIMFIQFMIDNRKLIQFKKNIE